MVSSKRIGIIEAKKIDNVCDTNIFSFDKNKSFRQSKILKY